ncbi:leucine-rich repeat-containing protein 56 [Helicoverpa zea]|uniref:leucine-rich repeat-containing protein 56 n=1 Tax=Helicoverpa zea TaxID=7113 RepID=UPI001F5909B8|nr:leucine-rich repeat-containing protein 56 [Helicoverpa zea]
MPAFEAPSVELGSAPRTPSIVASPSPSEISSASSPEPPNVRATPLFRALAMPPPEPEQPPGQDELERRLPGYRRIVIPRELTLIELLKQSSGVTTDDEVLRIREAKLRVVADRVGLRRLHVLSPRLRNLTLDGSALSSLRDLGIGLVHLKILSINRCGLSTLDGVWGLGALRELYAAGNRLHDLQPLAALQKLHTLNLADNPISDSGRLWTLGVCGALRKLTLTGTPAADDMDYRSRVAAALPMLLYLDDRPLHTDIEYDSEGIFGAASSSSDSEDEDEPDLLLKETEPLPAEPEPMPSTSQDDFTHHDQVGDGNFGSPECDFSRRRLRRRPATTENAGVRPTRPDVPLRPKTAQHRRSTTANEPSRLEILNTLMDDEWLCSGSKLTSLEAVCGNLARALRRTTSANRRSKVDAEKELVEQTMEDASRAIAAEIPRAPRLEDWVKFKEETGIDINIDFNDRPKDADPAKVLERLEQIEKETQKRVKEEALRGNTSNTDRSSASTSYLPNSAFHTLSIMNDFEMFQSFQTDLVSNASNYDLDSYFDDVNDLRSVSRERVRSPRNNDSLTE